MVEEDDDDDDDDDVLEVGITQGGVPQSFRAPLIVPVQHAELPPGRVAHPEPPQVPQLALQQTVFFPSSSPPLIVQVSPPLVEPLPLPLPSPEPSGHWPQDFSHKLPPMFFPVCVSRSQRPVFAIASQLCPLMTTLSSLHSVVKAVRRRRLPPVGQKPQDFLQRSFPMTLPLVVSRWHRPYLATEAQSLPLIT